MKYLSGQTMPGSIENALRLVAKTGFITRKLWNDHFAVGEKRWASKQLRTMLNRGLLLPHPNPTARNCFVSTPFGNRTIGADCAINIKPPSPTQLVHDELIVHSWLGLRKEICITDWRFESELKKPENNQFQLNVAADYPKYPDALFKLIAFEEERLCAFEYERSEKSLMRYRSILIRYSAIRSLWLLLIVYESETIRYRISSQLKRLNDPFLKSRLALVDKQSWLQSPARAPITLADKRFCLLELSSMYESTKAKKVVT